jgi:NAD(P)-dependent dehydrogenase (short-subunit alcohol dehydrogenase family)
MKLKDQVTIVTGAGSGIGRSIALKLSSEGSNIVIVYSRNDANADKSAQMIIELGREPLVIKADISNSRAVSNMVDEVVNRLGRIDCLVNNAGTFWSAPFLQLSEEAWDRVLDVDLKGTFLCSQAVGGYMKSSGQAGKIINIGSIHGTRAWKGASNYATAKAGLIQLTRAMALELADYNITVNLVSPGAIAAGPNVERLSDPDFMDRVEQEIPLGRMGTGDEVANLVLFLASSDSNYITGTEIVIDGGLLLYPFTV